MLETGVTWIIFFFLLSYLVPSIKSFNTLFLIIFPVTKLDKCQTKGPLLFYYFKIDFPFTNDFFIHI